MDKYELAIRQDKISAGKSSASDLVVIIGGIYAQAGQSIDGREIASMAGVLFRDLQTRYSMLTLHEVGLAFDNGLRGDYGQFYGLNVITFNNWLKAYRQSDDRFKAIKNMENIKNALPPPGAEYGEQRMREMCLRYFDSYKQSGDPGIACVTVYKHLQNIKVINQTKEYKMAAVNKVKATMESPNNLALPKEALENRVLFEAMKNCLKAFFQELIDLNTELKDVIK